MFQPSKQRLEERLRMPQLSLYLNDAAMAQLRHDAEDSGASLSRYVSQLVMDKPHRLGWPDGYWESVYGCLEDDSFQVPPELDGAADGCLPAF